MRLHDITETSRRVAETSGRLEKIGLVADCLAQMSPDEAEAGIAMLVGQPRQGRIGLGWATMQGARPSPASEPSLTVAEVDAALGAIAGMSGRGSAAARTARLRELLARATEAEQDYLVRLVLGGLRQGAEEGIMVEAIARAARAPVAAVRRATMLGGGLAVVGRAALVGGEAALGQFVLQLFRPLEPMLAQSAPDVDSALDRLGPSLLEHKLDGARVQVHRQGDEVRVYTRELNDVTARVPEVVAAARALPLQTVILDGEVIALRPDGRPEPFQVTMRRFGRKLEVEAMRDRLPLSPFFFDVLHADGQDVLDLPAAERMKVLEASVPAGGRVAQRVVTTPDEARAFFQEALASGHEGVMAKALDATYEAGRRGAGWLKVKPAHTLDLVVLAVERGSGRRRGWLSNLHLGARDPATGGFVMLGKTFKGMTDEMLKWQTIKLQELAVREEDGYVVWVRPELVVEIAFDGVQESSQYPGGVALRFARVKRYRLDKTAAEADTIDTVRALGAH